jgi:hypothetical protein
MGNSGLLGQALEVGGEGMGQGAREAPASDLLRRWAGRAAAAAVATTAPESGTLPHGGWSRRIRCCPAGMKSP